MSRRRTNIYLEDEQLEALDALRQTHGVPIAESVRRAVKEYLVKQEIVRAKTEAVMVSIEQGTD
jgi:hypothetical protein